MKLYVADGVDLAEGELSCYVMGCAILFMYDDAYEFPLGDCYHSKWLALASIERRLKTRLKKVQTEMDKIRIENPTEGE